MLSPEQKELLKQMKLAAIHRYGGILAASRVLGISRWGMRKAILGGAPNALLKMQEAGLAVRSLGPSSKLVASIATSETVDSNRARRLSKARFPFESKIHNSTPKTEPSLT